jgi:hypothetical protein
MPRFKLAASAFNHTSWRAFSTEKDKVASKAELTGILNAFHAPIRFACAYGSGAFPQDGYQNNKKPMVDFIFGVSIFKLGHAC